MSRLNTLLLLAMCGAVCAHGQQRGSTDLPFGGCYEVTSLSWYPPDDSIRLVPPRFELTSDNHVRPLPSKGSEIPWGSWMHKGRKLKVSFGLLGGFRGTLKPSKSGELVGKLKEWCDSRCEWKKRVAQIRIRRTDCTE